MSSPMRRSKEKTDLEGLKENIIIGHLIPAGTGMRDYRDIRAYKAVMGDLFYTEEELDQLYQGAQEKPDDAVAAMAPAGKKSGEDAETEESDEE